MAPVTGRFEADFANFYAAVDGATVKLRGFEGDANKVGASLNAMANRFSGQQVIQQATLMTEAVNRVGGAGKLTEQELLRIAPTINEAIAKMQALGQSVPTSMRELQAATKGVGSEVSTLGSLATQAAGPLIAMFSTQAVIGFTKEVFNAADAITKMMDQTDMTNEQVQRLQYVAGQVSTDMGTLVSAAQTLATRLGDGDKGVAGALDQLNISIEEFRRLNPYEQLQQIATGWARIEDPTRRASIANDLFGKQWRELAPFLKANMEDVAKGAFVMSDQYRKRLDDMGDGATGLWQNVKAVAGNTMGGMIDAWIKGAELIGLKNAEITTTTKKMVDSVKTEGSYFAQHAKEIAEENAKWLTDTMAKHDAFRKKQQDDAAASLARMKAAADAVIEAYGNAVDAIRTRLSGDDAIKNARAWADAISDLGDHLEKLSSKDLVDMESAMQAGLDAMARQGTMTSDLSSRFAELIVRVREQQQAATQTAPTYEQAQAAQDKYTRALYDAALAEDKQRDAIGQKNSQLRDTVSAANAAASALGGFAGYLPGTGGFSLPQFVLGGTSGGGTRQVSLSEYLGGGYTNTGAALSEPYKGGSTISVSAGRATGGPVTANTPYMVGERGPELFTPSSSGYITPNGAGGVVVQNVFNIVDTESEITRRVSESILRTITQARRVS